MKTLKLFLVTVFAVSALSVTAQTKNEIIKVWGNCETCKARIEKAAKDAGATTAKWEMKTQELSVAFNSASTSLKAIEEKIASAGHDTKNVTAKNEAYNNLPGCCQYERKQGTVAGVKSCCTAGASCCDGSEACCCSQTSKASVIAKADCCTDGGACCGSGQACCSKVAKTSAIDCCRPGGSCCGSGEACCSKSS